MRLVTVLTVLTVLSACGVDAIEADVADAIDDAAIADAKADEAKAAANRAETEAGQAKSTADKAIDDAKEAQRTADGAVEVAEGANDTANAAKDTANAAEATADDALASVEDMEGRMDSGEFIGEPGQDGADGSAGAAGPTGAAGKPYAKSHLFNVVGTSRTTIGSSAIWTVTASCRDTRDIAMTGGCEYVSSSKTCYNVQLVSAGARSNTGTSGTAAWSCGYVNEGTTGGNACAVRAYAHCVNL